jgi:ABC-type antimicrobial peptide transport system permease subunit
MQQTQLHIQTWLYLAGVAQVALVIGSLAIPKILHWTAELQKVQPLVRQLFWTYAAYILVINLCFGLLSAFAYRDLSDGSVLALAVTGFIAVYWISRLGIQFFYFDRSSFPKGSLTMLGEILLVALFVFLSTVYGAAFYFNYQQT